MSTFTASYCFLPLTMATMGLETALGNFFFRSKYSIWLWSTSTGSPFYVVRLVGAVLISLILVARAGKLFVYTR